MAKPVTKTEKEQILRDYVAGMQIKSIAQKFGRSEPTISKILNERKNSFQNDDLVVEKPKTQKELGLEIVRKATNALLTSNYDKIPPNVLLMMIERLSLLYGKGDADDNEKAIDAIVDKINVVSESEVIDSKREDNDD